MEYPTYKFIYARRGISASNGRGRVELEVYYKRIRRWYSTGLAVTPDQWDASSSMIVRHSEGVQLNMVLDSMRSVVANYIAELAQNGGLFSWEMLKIKMQSSNAGSCIDFVEQEMYSRNDIRISTLKTQAKLLGVLRDFKLIKTFSDLTPELIEKFDDYLHARGIAQSTVHSYHKFMKIYINRAIGKRLMKDSPYVGKKIERGKSTTRKYLTSAQLKILENAPNVPKTLHKVRDMFLFQCYTGLAYADLSTFDFTKVRASGDLHVLAGRRIKTGEDYYIVLLPEAMEILKRYKYNLPVMSVQWKTQA